MANNDDEGGIYIDLPQVNYSKASDIVAKDEEIVESAKNEYENVKIMKSLQDLPNRQPSTQFRLFKGGEVIENYANINDDDNGDSSDDESDHERKFVDLEDELSSDNADSSDDDSDGSGRESKTIGDRARQAAEMYLQRSGNLQDVIYG